MYVVKRRKKEGKLGKSNRNNGWEFSSNEKGREIFYLLKYWSTKEKRRGRGILMLQCKKLLSSQWSRTQVHLQRVRQFKGVSVKPGKNRKWYISHWRQFSKELTRINYKKCQFARRLYKIILWWEQWIWLSVFF